MQRTAVLVTSVLFLTVAGSAAHAQQGRGRGRGREGEPPPVPAEEQQRRVQDEQRRVADYRQHLDDVARAEKQREASLQNSRRVAQLRAQQEYAAELAHRQAALRTERDYAHEAYVTTPHVYQYHVSGASRETNQFGIDALRQAIRYGYQQGYRAGEADRLDHWHSDYASSPAYLDATYGYGGSYVDQADYSYYFRQGFQRGYTDGFSHKLQYGTASNGTYSILANVLGGILQLTTIH